MQHGFFLLVLGLFSAHAQNSIDQSATVNAAPPPDAETVQTDKPPVDEGLAVNGILAAPPVSSPRLATFAVRPSTLREGFAYVRGPATIASLSVPAIKQASYQVFSSDTDMVSCSPIAFRKGEQTAAGTLEITWSNVHHDCQVTLKIFDPNHPEIILRSRLYLRKSLEEVAP